MWTELLRTLEDMLDSGAEEEDTLLSDGSLDEALLEPLPLPELVPLPEPLPDSGWLPLSSGRDPDSLSSPWPPTAAGTD